MRFEQSCRVSGVILWIRKFIRLHMYSRCALSVARTALDEFVDAVDQSSKAYSKPMDELAAAEPEATTALMDLPHRKLFGGKLEDKRSARERGLGDEDPWEGQKAPHSFVSFSFICIVTQKELQRKRGAQTRRA